MLFLGNAQEHQTSFLDPFLHGSVPDRHIFTAARSPRGKMDQQDLLAPEIRERDRLARLHVRQGELWVMLAHPGGIVLCQYWGGQRAAEERQQRRRGSCHVSILS